MKTQLNNTLSTGIISGFRNLDGISYIQCDIDIAPGNSGSPLLDKDGNVIGIAVSGYLFHNSLTNINFFIPIKEAFKTLNIQLYPN